MQGANLRNGWRLPPESGEPDGTGLCVVSRAAAPQSLSDWRLRIALLAGKCGTGETKCFEGATAIVVSICWKVWPAIDLPGVSEIPRVRAVGQR